MIWSRLLDQDWFNRRLATRNFIPELRLAIQILHSGHLAQTALINFWGYSSYYLLHPRILERYSSVFWVSYWLKNKIITLIFQMIHEFPFSALGWNEWWNWRSSCETQHFEAWTDGLQVLRWLLYVILERDTCGHGRNHDLHCTKRSWMSVEFDVQLTMII